MDDEDEKFLSALFVVYTGEFLDGQPVMRGANLRDFLIVFIGAHKEAGIQAGMASYAAKVGEEQAPKVGEDQCPNYSHEGSESGAVDLPAFLEVMRDVENAMQPGTLKEIVSQRRLASCGSMLLLAKALKSMISLPPLPRNHLTDLAKQGKEWRP